MRVAVPLALLASLAVAAPAGAAQPVFGPTTKLDVRGGTEPRAAVGVQDHRYVITNRSADDHAAIWISRDKGKTWAESGEPYPGQTMTTIDTDVVTFPDGRVLATELDSAGVNFPTAVTDDEGKTWIESTGSTELADQDRQWVALGPKDPATGKNRVYLVFHNLVSGTTVHNIFVATSTDAGETFGVPVPVTVPGDDAFADLQCGAGYPSSMAVNQTTGQIYVFFISRSQPVGPANAGGCGASLLTTFESNIIGATRLWVATSPDGSAGSWTQSLAVDRTPTGQVVAMQFAPGALDNEGNVYIAFPESPNAYPNYDGAPIKLTHSTPDMAKWSEPVTLAEGGGAGNILPHIAVGDPGKVGIAYFKGAPAGDTPAWYLHVAQTLDGRNAKPTVVDQRVSDIANLTGTASELMGACTEPSPVSGILNGYTCGRAFDNFGMALDADCRMIVTWTANANSVQEDAPGTYVMTQTGGPALCGKDEVRGGSGAPVGPFCRDAIAPTATRSRKGVKASRRALRITGTAADRGCEGQAPDRALPDNVARVDVAVAREVGKYCAHLNRRGRFGRTTSCARPVFHAAKGTSRWTLTVKKARLKRGRYRLLVRATDRSGNRSSVRRPVRFRVR